ncbi:MAG: NAD(P)-dependent oxidoreductase [Planctomycetes bacterium]|nr:NAD(P)-dependent oxidoreductase [Planctomycetota bacterium]
MKIAFLGLGTMGEPMARNLLAKGFEVVVWNRSPGKTAAVEAAGGRVAATPRAAAEGVDLLALCVSDGPDVDQVLRGSAEAAIHGMAAGSLVVDFSTISPGLTRELAAAFAERGVGFVDAPVSGGSEGAQKGTLAIMCGGSEADVERARPVFAAVGSRATRVGDVGAGQVAKAVNQVVIAGTYQAIAEGLMLAEGCAVDPRKVVEAIRGGAAASWVLDNRSGNMIVDDYPLGFRLRLHRKDLGIALGAAAAAGVGMPVAALVAAKEDALMTAGHGDEDMSALARAARQDAGIAPGPLGGEG